MIREYDTIYNAFLSLFEMQNQEEEATGEGELLREIEAKGKLVKARNEVIENLEQEIAFLREEARRFEQVKEEFKHVNELRDKEETNKVMKMQEEILMLSQLKSDNSKTLSKMEKEAQELKMVLAQLSGEKSSEREIVQRKVEKLENENERLAQLESGLKDKVKFLEDQTKLMKKQVQKMLKERDKYHKKYNLMATLNKGHETQMKSIEKENKLLIEQKNKARKEVEELKESMRGLIREVGSLGVQKEALLDKLGHDARVTEQIEETDSLDDSLNETMNQDLREIELDFEQQGGLQELTTNERENLQIDETFEREIQMEEAHMKAVTGFGSNFMDEESQLDVTADFLNLNTHNEVHSGRCESEQVLGDAPEKTSTRGEAKEEEMKRIYDKVSEAGSSLGRSRMGGRAKLGSLRSINKEQAQKEFEKELDAKIKKRQEEGLSRIYASQVKSNVYDTIKRKSMMASTLATATPVHKSTFEFGIETRKMEMNLLKKTKETIGQLCKSMNQELFQGNEMRKLEKGIQRIKKVDDLVEWIFVYFTKKLSKMEGSMNNLRSDQCKYKFKDLIISGFLCILGVFLLNIFGKLWLVFGHFYLNFSIDNNRFSTLFS